MLRKVMFVVGVAFLAMFGLAFRCSAAAGNRADNRQQYYAERNHVHDAQCGHFTHEGRWYVAESGHVHGDQCGHEYREGVWVSLN